MATDLPAPSVPRHRAPAGAVDCHHHVYDPRYAFIPAASYLPGAATAGDYTRFRERIGIARSVVIQPSVYGTDNACTLDAVTRLAPAARAIVLIEDDTPRAALEAMARAGAVGVRLQTVGAKPGAFDRLERLAARVAELGWHLQLHVEPETIVEGAARLKRLAVPLVFDHFGRVPMASGAAHPAFRVLADLVAAGRTWVKLSAGYHFSKLGPPAYEDVGALTCAFLALAPERMLWGTDWPHPTETVKPDAAIMLDRFVEWAGSESIVRRVLVDNPAVVYGFPAA